MSGESGFVVLDTYSPHTGRVLEMAEWDTVLERCSKDPGLHLGPFFFALKFEMPETHKGFLRW